MKYLIILTSLLVLSFSNCTKKDCNQNCTTNSPACTEIPPINELCQAAFNRWFYNSNTKTCTQIGYSGCSQKGFATEQECLACDCNNPINTPQCIEEKLATFKSERMDQGVKLEAYIFQNATVYAFDYGLISDASIEVYDKDCVHLGTLNGIAGFKEINGIEFFPNAALLGVIWQR